MRLLVTTMFLVGLVCGPAWAKSYDHPLIEQTYRLLPNGDAEVEEIRTFRFDGSFTWATITRSTSGQYGSYSLEYAGVWDADANRPLRFQVERSGSDVTLRWFYSAENTTKRFLIRYRISNAIQRYQDVAQFYWQAVEGDHAPINRVHITLVPPQPSLSTFKVFIHGRARPGTLTIADDGSRAVIEQEDIPETSFVEVRAFLDPAIFVRAPVRSGQTYESLLKDEQTQLRGELRLQRFLTYGFVLAGLLIAGLIVGYIWTYLRYGKEWQVRYDAPYEREVPRPLPPAVLPAIMTQGRVQNSELSKGFAATLLDAARFGYLEIVEHQDEGLLGTGLLRDTDLIYRLTDKGVALLNGDAPAHLVGERKLEPFEVAVLEVVFKKAGTGPVVSSDKIEEWGRRIVRSKSNYLRFIEVWGPQLRSWFERTYFKIDDPTSERAKIVFIVVTVVVLGLVFLVGFGVSMIVGLPVGIGLIGLSMKGLSRRTPDAALEVKRWEAFRRFMTDFSAMKEAGPQLLNLWEHYLVYATALGVAERLLENLKLVAAQLGRPASQPTWFRPVSASDRGMSAFSLDSLDNLGRSFNNLQSLARAVSRTGGSGGGFGGGGGGGGGGGSSRAG
jgi:uncharacterized membrane protein